MIPIINVVFLVLIYFITQGSFEKADPVTVNVPRSSSGTAVSADPIQLIVTYDKIMIDGEAVELAHLKDKIEVIAEKYPGKQILLKSDANLDSTKLIEILKIIKQAKISNLYLVTTSP